MEGNGGNGTDLVKIEHRSAQTALEPQTVAEAYRLASQLVASGLLGKSIQKPEAALAVILTGRELGLTVMQSLRSIHVIEGKPSLSADLIVALVKRSPKCKYFKLVDSTSKIATYETYRHDEGITRMSFTIEQAAAAGVVSKDNWKKWPDAMLRARCIAALARAVYPDLLAGIYETDELQPSQREPLPEQLQVRAEKLKEVYVENAVWHDVTDEDRIAASFSSDIGDATTEAELLQVGKEIKAAKLSDAKKLMLSAEYADKRKRLKEAAIVKPATGDEVSQ